jgi:hypothetical protein
MTWNHETSLFAGQDQNNDNMKIELWWAYAHNIVTNNILSITRGSGGTTTSQSHGFAVKGLNGNYGNPFDRFENPFSYGNAIGGFFGSDTAQKAFIPYADGPMDTVTGTAPAFDSSFATGVVLSGSNLIITSSGSGNPNNYAYLNPATAGKVGGRYYFEVTFNTINGADYSAGIFYNPAVFSTLLSLGVTGFMVRGSGHIFNGSDVATLGVTPANGDVIAYFIDLDNGSAWARDVTQGGNWNGDATADPKYNAGGISIAPDTGSLVHTSTNGQNTALATVVGAPAGSASAQMTFNFAGPFAGTVPTGGGEWFSGYTAGTTIPFPAVNFVATTSCTPAGFGGLDTFGGFTTLTQDGVVGSQRDMEMIVQARVLSNNIQVTDNDIIQGVSTAANWLMIYNTLVPGVTDPGSLEATDTADSASFIGYAGAFGVVGDLGTTETADIAAIFGFENDSGVWASTEAADIFGASGRLPLVGTLAATEATDIFVAAGVGLGENGTWISTEGVDILTISGNTPITATFVSTEIADRFVAIGAGVTQSSRRRQLIVT